MRVTYVALFVFAVLFIKDIPQAGQSEPNNGQGMVIQDTTGDLDKDGVPERLELVNGAYRKDTGAVREIRIYKKSNNAWVLWHKSIGAVLSEGESYPGEDPFSGLHIERGCIVVEHGFGAHGTGGLYIHRFRYQHNDWYLIGVTHTNATPCNESYDELEKYDFNLSTKSLFVEYKYETCEDTEEHTPRPKNMPRDTSFTLKVDKFHNIKMDGYEFSTHQISIPGFHSKELIF